MNFPGYEILQWIVNNWYWTILGWFVLSILVSPLIGRFCSLGTQYEERSLHCSGRVLRPSRALGGPRARGPGRELRGLRHPGPNPSES
jgi:hypothetical protein